MLTQYHTLSCKYLSWTLAYPPQTNKKKVQMWIRWLSSLRSTKRIYRRWNCAIKDQRLTTWSSKNTLDQSIWPSLLIRTMSVTAMSVERNSTNSCVKQAKKLSASFNKSKKVKVDRAWWLPLFRLIRLSWTKKKRKSGNKSWRIWKTVLMHSRK
jgi:hypothetical protein